tara:strand:- start:952 stop:2211 length:1260 start_codon:yes stop_codon:yes gene_type:complete
MSISKKNIFIIFLLYFSLILGFYLNEDTIGGAFNDYSGLLYLPERFKSDFWYTFFNYESLGHRHSPIFFILRSFFLPLGEDITRLIILNFYMLCPIYVYKSLKIILGKVDKNFLILIAFVILTFPTFRSYAIWSDAHMMGATLFTISIYYFLKFKYSKKDNFRYALMNCIFLALSSYFSPNFGMFVFYFFYEFLIKFNFSKKVFFIILLNILLSAPFFIYIFVLDINFIYNDNKWDIGDNFLSIKHFSNKFHILNTLILFYILPFVYFIKDVFLRKYNSKEYTIIALSILLFFFLTYFFNYSDTYNLTKSGGGFFYNLSQRLLENNYLFFICSLLGFLIIITISFVDVKNFGLFILLILSNPQNTVWQSNYSPTLYILLILLFNMNLNKIFFNLKFIYFLYFYFLSYLFLNLLVRNHIV